MRQHDYRPGCYVYDVVSDSEGARQSGVPTNAVVFVLSYNMGGVPAELHVRFDLDAVEIRCSEGVLGIFPQSSNSVRVRPVAR